MRRRIGAVALTVMLAGLLILAGQLGLAAAQGDGVTEEKAVEGPGRPSIPSPAAVLLPEGSGGPDEFGYWYRDSDAIGGPVYHWVEISGTNVVPFGDDTTHGPYDIGFSFDFYGVNYDQFWVDSNGWVSLGAANPGSSAPNNDCPLPSAGSPDNIVAAYWDDWDPNYLPLGKGWHQSYPAGSCAYPGYAGACLVVAWHDMYHYEADVTQDGATFEVVLFDDNNILVQVAEASEEQGDSSTIGLENSDATDGIVYACDTTQSVRDELAVEFVYPTPGPNLVASTKLAPAFTSSGLPLTYTIVLSNAGDLPADSVVLSDPLPVNTVYIPDSLACATGACSATADFVGWSGQLAAGQAATITFAVDTTGSSCGAIILNSAVITDPGMPSAIGVEAETVLLGPELAQWDLEADDGGWTADPVSEWQWGLPLFPAGLDAHSGDRVWGVDLTGDADDTIGHHLLTKTLTLPDSPTGLLLEWWDWNGAELSDERRVLVNDSVIWSDGGDAEQRHWASHLADLSPWTGQQVDLVFDLAVCCTNPGPDGWYFDDVRLLAGCPAVRMTPAEAVWPGCIGGDAEQLLEVRNANTIPDIVTLAVGSSPWPTALSSDSLPLDPGESAVVTLTVSVPPEALPNDGIHLWLTGTAQTSGLQAQIGVDVDPNIGHGWDYLEPSPRGSRRLAVVYHAGYLYQIGGEAGGAYSGTHRYEIATGDWVTLSDMVYPAYYMDAAAIDEMIYVPGGHRSDTAFGDALQVLDTADGTWSTAAAMPQGLRYHQVVAVGNLLYVLGGQTSDGSYSDNLYIYDPITDTWGTGAYLPTGVAYASAGVMGDEIYLVGGYNGEYQTLLQVYDPATDSWRQGAPPPHNWVKAADGVLKDRFLVLIGGYHDSLSTSSNLVLVYDQVRDAWFYGPSTDSVRRAGEADGDGSQLYYLGGREYEEVWFNSDRLERLLECEPLCDLELVKTGQPDSVLVGSPLTYTLVVSNHGFWDATDVVVTDTLPAGVELAAYDPTCSYQQADHRLDCSLGELSRGAELSVTIVVTPEGSLRTITNTGRVASTQRDPRPESNLSEVATRVTQVAVALEKTVGRDQSQCGDADSMDIPPGAEVTYCYRATNTGRVPLITHSLTDSELGNLLDGLSLNLEVGATATLTWSAEITETTVNLATWTASDGIEEAVGVDSALVSVHAPVIELTKTVGTDPNSCALESELTVEEGEPVVYCYEVSNQGVFTLPVHSLTDSELGQILTDQALELGPGASTWLTVTALLTRTTVNTAAWTARDELGNLAVATDTATVELVQLPPVCGLQVEGFDLGVDAFPPPFWRVENLGGTCVWQSSEETGRDNLTGGDGYAASADADWCGSGTTVNSQLYSPIFTLKDATAPYLIYRHDYDDRGTADHGWVDLSLDGGDAWTNLISYTEDARGPATHLIDLAPYTGTLLAQLRFGYAGAYDWWFQVDDVSVTCDDSPALDLFPGAITETVQVGDLTRVQLGLGNVGVSSLAWGLSAGCGSPVPWLSLTAEAGTVAPYETDVVTVTLDAASLAPGDYSSSICVGSSDPDQLAVVVPVDLTVEGWADLVLSPSAITVTQRSGESQERHLTIGNDGGVNLNWELQEQPGGDNRAEIGGGACMVGEIPWVTVAPEQGTVAPGFEDVATVTFDSSDLAPGTYQADLCLLSNDPDDPLVLVPLHMEVSAGYGIYLPLVTKGS